jgi:hypothetical protein
MMMAPGMPQKEAWKPAVVKYYEIVVWVLDARSKMHVEPK